MGSRAQNFKILKKNPRHQRRGSLLRALVTFSRHRGNLSPFCMLSAARLGSKRCCLLVVGSKRRFPARDEAPPKEAYRSWENRTFPLKSAAKVEEEFRSLGRIEDDEAIRALSGEPPAGAILARELHVPGVGLPVPKAQFQPVGKNLQGNHQFRRRGPAASSPGARNLEIE